MSEQLVIYDQHAERYQRAWEAFNRLYVLEHPEPRAPRWYQGLPWLMAPFAVIAIAGIGLSAMRTAPVFQQVARPLVGNDLATAEAVMAIIVIEVTIVVVRYVRLLQRAEDGKLGDGELQRWMEVGFWLAFTVAILANLYASVKHVELITFAVPVLDLVIALAVGLSAPVLAFVSGDVLASLYLRSEKRRNALREAFSRVMQEWREARERSWNARKVDYGLRIKVENMPPSGAVHSLNSLNGANEQSERSYSANSPNGYSKRMDAKEVARRFFTDNPDRFNDKLDDLVSAIEQASGVKVGRTSIHNVRKEMLEQPTAHANGHRG